MIKQVALSAVVASLFAGAAFAQSTPPADQQPSAPQAQPAPAPQSQPSAPQGGQPSAGAPQNPDECIQAASGLAEAAEAKKLSEEKLDKIEDLLTKMETHCDAKQFVEAMAVAKDIKSLIDAN